VALLRRGGACRQAVSMKIDVVKGRKFYAAIAARKSIPPPPAKAHGQSGKTPARRSGAKQDQRLLEMVCKKYPLVGNELLSDWGKALSVRKESTVTR